MMNRVHDKSVSLVMKNGNGMVSISWALVFTLWFILFIYFESESRSVT